MVSRNIWHIEIKDVLHLEVITEIREIILIAKSFSVTNT